MSIRSGMTDLIAELRTRADAGTADYTSGTATFWTDEQLQAVLDRRRTTVRREPLASESEYSGGSVVTRDYTWRGGPWVEALGADAAIWRVEDSAGSALGTALYTPEYAAGRLRFAADTGGTAYTLTYRAYDLDRAAADVWEAKAASVAGRFDIRVDNHDLKRSQLRSQYLDMAASWRRRAGAATSTRVRDDLTGEAW